MIIYSPSALDEGLRILDTHFVMLVYQSMSKIRFSL